MKTKLYCATFSLLLLTACSTLQHTTPIQPITHTKVWDSFNGQLSILEPSHRWQVLIHWQATLESGKARLTHAATGRIIELQWHGKYIQIRNNQADKALWKNIKEDALMHYGIVLPPQTIAAILHHHIPPSLKLKQKNTWQGPLHGSMIRLRWQTNYHKLTMTDITHGRTAILRIFP